ncbi:DUF3667 domain-containing protein [Thermaurantiacus sp.]
MAGEVEAAGQFATAVAAARAVEGVPAAHAREAAQGACLNCGATLAGAYCSKCGQKAHVERSLGHALHELVHGVLHFDGKLWNTLPLLVARPGKLTRDYIDGKRARFISPIGLFLLTVFLMFLVFGFMGGGGLPAEAIQLDRASAEKLLAETDARIAELDKEIAARRDRPGDAQAVAALEASRAGAVALKARVTAGLEPGTATSSVDLGGAIRQAAESGGLTIDTGNPGLDAKIAESLKNPEFVFYKMKQKGYKLSFLLVPLSLPWLWLMFFWKKDVVAYDHVVFLLYSISFVSILFLLLAILVSLGVQNDTLFGIMFGAVPLLHMFLQLKEGYRLGVGGALWRTGVLAVGSVMTLGLYVVGILFLGVLD